MKKTRKLIPAIAMLLVSLIVMSSASFAWFSMNKQVSATGMQITANSDSVYLLIDTKEAYDARDLATPGTGLTGLQDAAKTTVTLIGEDNVLYPAAWKKATPVVTDSSSNELGSTKASGTPGVGTEIADATKWYKAEAATVNASAAATNKGVALTAFTNYVKVYNYVLTLAKGSNAVEVDKLKVTYAPTMTNVKTGDAETMDAVRVLVVCGDRYEEFEAAGTGTVALNAATITDAAVTNVSVYVYYDGNDASVYTNNVANLEGATFDLTFSVE